MGRQKVTVSLSSRCLQLIDKFGETTGFETRSRVIEEMTFAIADLLGYRKFFGASFSPPKKNYSQEEVATAFINLMGVLSRIGGILDRFERFAVTSRETVSGKKYRYVPVEERTHLLTKDGE